MSRIGFAGLVCLSASLAGCGGFDAFDRAAAELASSAKTRTTCTIQPAIGADNWGGRSCTFNYVIHESTTTTTTVTLPAARMETTPSLAVEEQRPAATEP